jgi:hypothetical protein
VTGERREANSLINDIRARVDHWRAFDYPGVTPVTRESSWVTGQSITVDGGTSLRRFPDLTEVWKHRGVDTSIAGKSDVATTVTEQRPLARR